MDMIYHAAAKAGVWGALSDYYQTNVLGTQNIVKGCRDHGVAMLVYTSSPSVVFDGSDEEGINEEAPYPKRFLSHYSQTKAEAERFVLAAADPRLRVVALRPHLIWGPGDPHLVPRVLNRSRAGRLKLVGDGRKRVDSTYIDNAVDAHLAAGQALLRDDTFKPQAYFISNDEPLEMGQLLNKILDAGGEPPVTARVAAGTAYRVGMVLEGLYRLMGSKSEPIMTRFVARQLATAHWFDLSAAKRDLGYRPEVSIDEGMLRLSQWLNDHPQ
jgi:nucleoside-diphosphate-sugar epimerase